MTDGSLVSARLLVFRVGTLACAAEVDQVREILPRLPTTRIPGAPPVVAGLVNVRGTLVTVVEGWRALGQAQPGLSAPPSDASQSQAPDAAGSTLILEVGQGGEVGAGNGSGRKLIGFTVDEVMDMLAVADTTLEDRRSLPGVDPTLVRAVGRRNGELFIVLDVAALLGPILTS
ncbi:MAG TPA: chemotaxis protein CheW [Gemmatimonadales bacterium]|jgi:chemotaxis signal transduction protein|nr:chemotaxis protein CheW [Gemmatimonadales bacterium]